MNTMEGTPRGPSADAHLDDERLLALLDGEPGGDRPAWTRHVSACSRCRDDYARLEARAAVVSGWFAATEPASVLARPKGRVASALGWTGGAGWRAPGAWLKAAAVLLLFAAPALAFPGVRAWMAGGDPGGAEGAAPPRGSTLAAPPGSILRFAPSGDELAVRVGEGVGGGRLTLARSGSDEVVVEIASAGTSATVSGAGMTLRGAGGPASLTVRVPASVVRVRVLGLRAPIDVDVAGLSRPVAFELGR